MYQAMLVAMDNHTEPQFISIWIMSYNSTQSLSRKTTTVLVVIYMMKSLLANLHMYMLNIKYCLLQWKVFILHKRYQAK